MKPLRRRLPARRQREARLRRRPRLESLESRQLMATLSMRPQVEYLESRPVQLAQGLQVSYADGSGFAGSSLTVAVTSNRAAEDRLQVVGSGNLTAADSELKYDGQTFASYSGGAWGQPLRIDFSDSATTFAAEALLKQLYFDTKTESPSPAKRTVTLSLRAADGTALDQDTVDVAVYPVNDRPWINGLQIERAFGIDQGPVLVAPQASVSDPDHTHFGGGILTARIAANAQSTDQLLLVAGGDLSQQDDVLFHQGTEIGVVSQSASSLSVTFNGAADATAVQAVLRAVAFNNTSSLLQANIRRIDLSLIDPAGASSNVRNVFVPVRAATDLPGLSGLTDVQYQEHDSALIAPNAVLSGDSNAWTREGLLTIVITGGRESSDYLYVKQQEKVSRTSTYVRYGGQDVGRVVGGFGNEPLRIAFNSLATNEAVQAIVRSVAFASASSNPGTQARQIEVRLDHTGTGSSVTAELSVEMAAVNTAPFVSTTDIHASYVEGREPVLIGPTHTIIDFDSADFDGGTLTVAVASGRGATDRLGIAAEGSESGQIGIDGESVTFGETAIGMLSVAADASSLTVTLNGQATPESVTALVRRLTFVATGSEIVTGERSITIGLTDGDGGTSEARKTSVFVMSTDQRNVEFNVWPIEHDMSVRRGWIRMAPEVVLPDLSAYAGGHLKVDTTTQHYNYDQFWILHQGDGPGEIGFDKDTKAVTYGGYRIGRMLNTSLNPLDIQLDPRISHEAMQALVRQVAILPNDTDIFRTGKIRFTQDSLPEFKLPEIPIVAERFDFFPLVGFASPQYIEGSDPQIVSPSAYFDDSYAANLAGGVLTFTVEGASPRYDSMAIAHEGDDAGQIGVGAGEVRYGGRVIAQYGGGFAGQSLQILFNEQSSPDAAEALLQRITYQWIGSLPGNPQVLTVTATTGQGDVSLVQAPVQRDIGLYAVDDPPVLLGLNAIGLGAHQPASIAPNVVLVDPGNVDYSWHTLKVRIAPVPTYYLQLGLLNQGDGPGQFRWNQSGTDLYYEGQRIGRIEYRGTSSDVREYWFRFEQTISRDAVQRLMRSIALTNVNMPVQSSLIGQVSFQFDDHPGTEFAVTLHAENKAARMKVEGEVDFVENGGPTRVALAAEVEEVDAGSLDNGNLRVSLVGRPDVDSQLSVRHQGFGKGQIGVDGSRIFYASTLIGVLSGGLGGHPLVVTFTSAADVGKVKALIRNVTFVSTSDNPPATQHVEFVLTDSHGGGSASSICTVKIQPVNDATTLVASGMQFVFPLGDDRWETGEGAIAPQADLFDPDSPDFAGGILSVWMDGATSQDYLRPDWQPALLLSERLPLYVDDTEIGVYSGGRDGTPLTVSFNSDATPVRVETLMRRILFGTVSPYDISHDVHLVLRDGDGGISNKADLTVRVLGINAAPVLDNSLSPTLQSIAEDTADPTGTLVSTLVKDAVTDINSSTVKGIAVTGASDYHGFWQYSLNNGVTWTRMGGPSESAALLLPDSAQVRFIPKTDFHGTVKMSYRAWDRTAGYAGGTLDTRYNRGGIKSLSTAYESAALTVTPVNDPPKLSFSESTGYTHDKPAIRLAAYATVSDVDDLHFAGGELRVRITDGASSSNRLSIGSGFTIDASNRVLQGTTVIGQRLENGWGTNDLVIKFNDKATPSAVQQLVRSITFKTVGGEVGQRKVLFTLSDGDGGVAEATKVVDVR